jgi:hypothetical protein
LLVTTRAKDGVLLVRRYDAESATEICQVYNAQGKKLDTSLVPFARSVAATAVSMQEPCTMNQLGQSGATATVELQPFEKNRHSLLAAPLAVAPGIHVVLELFDKQAASTGRDGAFTDEDQQLVRAAADFGAEMLRQALGQRETHQVLFDAVGAALGATAQVTEKLRGQAVQRLQQPPPAAVLDQLREGLSATAAGSGSAEDTLRLAEAIRVLALRHGAPAVQHCIRLVESLRTTLDAVTGT